MKNNTLISVRSNCNFSLNYEDGTLHPQGEIIIITTAPKYEINKKEDGYVKELDISEYRFVASSGGINKLIGELQLVIKNMTTFEQMAASFNAIIKSSQENNPK